MFISSSTFNGTNNLAAKMKLIIASLALLVASASCVPFELDVISNQTEKEELVNDLKEFVQLIPVKPLNLLYVKYALTDYFFRRAVIYAQSPHHRELATRLSKTKAVRDLHNYLNVSSSNTSFLLNEIENRISVNLDDIEDLEDKKSEEKKGKKGHAGFMKEAKALLPIEQIKQLRDQKIQANGTYAALVRKIRAEEFLLHVSQVLQEPVGLELLQESAKHGLSILGQLDFTATLLGLKSK